MRIKYSDVTIVGLARWWAMSGHEAPDDLSKQKLEQLLAMLHPHFTDPESARERRVAMKLLRRAVLPILIERDEQRSGEEREAKDRRKEWWENGGKEEHEAENARYCAAVRKKREKRERERERRELKRAVKEQENLIKRVAF